MRVLKTDNREFGVWLERLADGLLARSEELGLDNQTISTLAAARSACRAAALGENSTG